MTEICLLKEGQSSQLPQLSQTIHFQKLNLGAGKVKEVDSKKNKEMETKTVTTRDRANNPGKMDS